MLAHILNYRQEQLYIYSTQTLTKQQLQDLTLAIARRVAGEPVAYITAKKDFWSFSCKVTPAVLIPRPETEQLVEIMLHLPNVEDTQLLELGTGSGVIAIAMAKERSNWGITACDISAAALKLAQENACINAMSNITWCCSNWFESIIGKFNIIVSNPPYISEDDPYLTALKYEPRAALVAKDHGLADLQHIIKSAPHYLISGGCLILEHGSSQSEEVAAILRQQGYINIVCYKDLAGKFRITMAFYV